MSDAELNALERDVEQARARFADDLARLRSPSTLARFKDDAWAEARDTKDELVGKTKEAAKDGAQRLFTELKERAAANPVAALAIGAGLAWRLVHRPPIATLLVGMGVVGLLRTSPARNSEPYMGLHDEDPRLLHRYGAGEPGLAARAGELADVVKDKVQDWSAEAGDAARATATQVAETTTAVAERASRALRDVRDVARDTAANVGDRAATMAERASDGLHDATNTARITAAGVGDKAAAVAGQASQAVQDASDTVRETVAHMADKAAVLGQQASASNSTRLSRTRRIEIPICSAPPRLLSPPPSASHTSAAPLMRIARVVDTRVLDGAEFASLARRCGRLVYRWVADYNAANPPWEESMKKLTLVLALCIMSGPAFATCKSDAADKKLAGAALKSFMTKCERDATTTCETDSKDKKLAGAAKTSHMKKCVGDAVGT